MTSPPSPHRSSPSALSVGTSLPSPERTRWQPLRTGLIDLFYYDAEEFRFRDGRLLLRGNNGTGKSKVLALTAPFSWTVTFPHAASSRTGPG
ncbi:hypothetical protein [Streptomyces sp. NRRL S-1868]|uniref:hypothetical protein n=1 Tax=Streptomyces sp. NRRL S-1868 TaxID=1463892 RepID=UPI000ADE6DE5|nr:hypothetical protein [Streptomyces sp. NRRL S-1868]